MMDRAPAVDVLTRAQVRDVDRRAIEDYGQPGVVLMENAGRNAADLLRKLGIRGRVTICCGKGNNAGDGFVVARHLENAGIPIEVILATSPLKFAGDAAINFAILRRAGTPIFEPDSTPIRDAWRAKLLQSDWLVDAILGTGAQGTISPPFSDAIHAINESGVKVLSLDLPSGMDCDTGQPLGCCVNALHTATFVARKPGFDCPGARERTGEIHVLDIGVPRRLLEEVRLSAAGAAKVQ